MWLLALYELLFLNSSTNLQNVWVRYITQTLTNSKLKWNMVFLPLLRFFFNSCFSIIFVATLKIEALWSPVILRKNWKSYFFLATDFTNSTYMQSDTHSKWYSWKVYSKLHGTFYLPTDSSSSILLKAFKI